MDDLELEFVFRGVDPNSCDASELIIAWLGTHPGYFVQGRLREHFGNCSQCTKRTPELLSFFNEMDSERITAIVSILQEPEFLLEPLDDRLDKLSDLPMEAVYDDLNLLDLEADDPEREELESQLESRWEEEFREPLRKLFRARWAQVLARLGPLFHAVPFARTANWELIYNDDLSEVPFHLRDAIPSSIPWDYYHQVLRLGSAIADMNLPLPNELHIFSRERKCKPVLDRFFSVRVLEFEEWELEAKNSHAINYLALQIHLSRSMGLFRQAQRSKTEPHGALGLEDLRGDLQLYASGFEAESRGIREGVNKLSEAFQKLAAEHKKDGHGRGILADLILGDEILNRLSDATKRCVHDADIIIQNSPEDCGNAWMLLRKAFEFQYAESFILPLVTFMEKNQLEEIWIKEMKVSLRFEDGKPRQPATLDVVIKGMEQIHCGNAKLDEAQRDAIRKHLEEYGATKEKCEQLRKSWRPISSTLNNESHGRVNALRINRDEFLQSVARIRGLFLAVAWRR